MKWLRGVFGLLLISGGPHKANIIGTHLNVVPKLSNWQLYIYILKRDATFIFIFFYYLFKLFFLFNIYLVYVIYFYSVHKKENSFYLFMSMYENNPKEN